MCLIRAGHVLFSLGQCDRTIINLRELHDEEMSGNGSDRAVGVDGSRGRNAAEAGHPGFLPGMSYTEAMSVAADVCKEDKVLSGLELPSFGFSSIVIHSRRE